jgi:signal transduction histidine kinase
VTDQSLIERLAALPILASVPREQLEWLVAHGEIRHFPAGHVLATRGQQAIVDLWIVLSGRLSIRLDHEGITRTFKEWTRGDLSGLLPYSRLSKAIGDVQVDEPVELFVIPNALVKEMTRTCYEFTALCVHEMIDRARQFKSQDLVVQKLASLGVLSAGIAHELNNPSSALARSAKELAACHAELVETARAVGEARLTAAQLAALAVLEHSEDTGAADLRSPLDRADREDAGAAWLEAHRIDPALAEPLARSTATEAQLDDLARVLEPGQLDVALRYVAAELTARRLTLEIERAAGRIHQLAAIVKKQTHMDRVPVADAIALEENLSDTLILMGSKARAKSVTLELRVEPDLQPLAGIVGELNQVWLNLIDNAIDAAPEGGHVWVSAERGRDSVVVKVTDDGGGIAAADRDRIFEPFYTTKPVGKGTGLGLGTVQEVVRGHRGSVEVNSAPGRTEFRVCLPATSPTPPPASARPGSDQTV